MCEQSAQAGGQVRLAASVPNRAELGDIVRNQLTECRRLGVTIEYGIGVWPGLVDRTPTRPRHRRHRRRAGAPVVGARATRPTSSTSATCSTATRVPSGDVVVIDEIGFHHATSVAELLADRGCAVEVVTPGMVVGQDLGITLDMENWWIRATAKGIVQSHRPGADGYGRADRYAAAPPHRRADHELRRTGWCSPCRRARSSGCTTSCERGVSVERVGDCIAPRRAHAAVIDGDRAGASV